LPFDKRIHNRKEYVKKYNESEEKLFLAWNNAFDRGLIPSSLNEVHSTYHRYNNWFYHTAKKSYREINKPNLTDSIRIMMKFEEGYFPELIDSVWTFSEYKEWYIERVIFWKFRNEIWANNIIRYIEMTKAKKVVVLTGLLQ